MSRFPDIAGAARLASRLVSSAPLDRSYLTEDIEPQIRHLVTEAGSLVEDETGMRCSGQPRALVVSRAEWASANVDSLLTLVTPLLEKVDSRIALGPASSLFRMAYRPAVGAELGVVLGLLSTRVLGQYDLFSESPDDVMFITPNLVLMERRFGFVPKDFRLWVITHELTHRAQFQGNDWLRRHFMDSIGELLKVIDIDALSLIGQAAKAGRDPNVSLRERFLGSSARERFRSMQALMSVIEGHGNFVMDRVALDHIPTAPLMRRVLSDAAPAGFLGKLITRLLGLELKRAQYRDGQVFFETIFEHGGQEAVGACFQGAENLPTMEEVKEPKRWLERVAV